MNVIQFIMPHVLKQILCSTIISSLGNAKNANSQREDLRGIILLHRLLNDKKFKFITSLPPSHSSPPPPSSPSLSSSTSASASSLTALQNHKCASEEFAPELKDTSNKRRAAKRSKKAASIAKKPPPWSDISVIEYAQNKGVTRKLSANRTAKPTLIQSKGNIDKSNAARHAEYSQLDMSSRQTFFPSLLFPLYDEIDDAIVQTVGGDESVADFRSSPFFSFSTSSSINDVDLYDQDNAGDDKGRYNIL